MGAQVRISKDILAADLTSEPGVSEPMIDAWKGNIAAWN
jgi:hypothetical protein